MSLRRLLSEPGFAKSHEAEDILDLPPEFFCHDLARRPSSPASPEDLPQLYKARDDSRRQGKRPIQPDSQSDLRMLCCLTRQHSFSDTASLVTEHHPNSPEAAEEMTQADDSSSEMASKMDQAVQAFNEAAHFTGCAKNPDYKVSNMTGHVKYPDPKASNMTEEAKDPDPKVSNLTGQANNPNSKTSNLTGQVKSPGSKASRLKSDSKNPDSEAANKTEPPALEDITMTHQALNTSPGLVGVTNQTQELSSGPVNETMQTESQTGLAFWLGPAAKDMALSGFRRVTRHKAQCCYCKVTLRNWRVSDDPWQRHKSFSPLCRRLLQVGERGIHASAQGKRRLRHSFSSFLDMTRTF